ncbi:MAG: putative DNA binding domain-containing protein [Actinomycetaceae bacterium]|nr:putative DNA binding domain-containing protein [Actinomycetaceae bacterium]
MKEHKRLEYKREITDSFLKTVSAFANYDGGDIVFGISDTGQKVGIKNIDDTCLAIENKINDSVAPKPDFTLSVKEKDSTIVLHVDKGFHPPYYYKKKAYKRNDTSTVEVDTFELKRLILAGENLNFEDIPSRNQELTFQYLSQKFESVLRIEKIDINILKTLNLFTENKGFNVAAELLSDQNSFRGVDVARFGETMDVFLDRATFENASLVEIFDETIKKFETYYSYEKVVGATREKTYTIPYTAFREALANALVHRHWDIDARVRVSMFDDRVEIVSPGGLPDGMSKEEYLHGKVSVFRNPIVSNVFFRLGIIETFGTGIIKIKQAYEQLKLKPQFDLYENSITIILPTRNAQVTLTPDEQKVFEYVSGGKVLSSSEIATAMGWSKGKTIQVIKALVASRLLKAEGSGRGTKYRNA